MQSASRRGLLTLVLFALIPLFLFAGRMLHTETTIPVPASEDAILLTRLVYKARFEAKVTSVRLERTSEPDADPMVARWVFTGSNSDGQVHRLEIQIRLLDENGKQVGWFVGKHPLAAGAAEQTFSVRMKVKPEVWSAVRRVRIFADWMS